MNRSITVIRNASISSSIRETTRYFINVRSKLAHDCLPKLKIIFTKNFSLLKIVDLAITSQRVDI